MIDVSCERTGLCVVVLSPGLRPCSLEPMLDARRLKSTSRYLDEVPRPRLAGSAEGLGWKCIGCPRCPWVLVFNAGSRVACRNFRATISKVHT